MSSYYIYDIETFPNCFLFTGKFRGANEYQQFEISPRRNDRDDLLRWLQYLRSQDVFMVGYNNLGFDYPIIHELINSPWDFSASKAHSLAEDIISRQEYGFTSIPYSERFIRQIDLVKINHFDNKMKRTSLKAVQFATRAESIEDLPFDVRPLTFPEMDVLRSYNLHDVVETERFFEKCFFMIEINKSLYDNGILRGDVLNWSNVKLGVEYLISKIGRSKCYDKGKPRQTHRSEVQFSSIISPKIYFKTEEFQSVLNWFKKQTIYIHSKEERPSLSCTLAGLPFEFGVGGVHASVSKKHFRSDDDNVIKDIDVSGMYGAVALACGFYPEHLGETFVTAYRQLQIDRKKYPKGTPMNFVLKLAVNGVFGKSGDIYSPFYDPKYTYSVTVNGQLFLLQLVEAISMIPGLKLIQANTDGITCVVPRKYLWLFEAFKSQWEKETSLKLEEVEYTDMWIRDVNNYLARDIKGNIKRKGAYWYPVTDDDYWGSSGSNWNKDFSNLASIKAAELCMLHGVEPSQAIRMISDPFDFMIRRKAQDGAKLFIDDRPMTKTLRYYVSTAGGKLRKISPPKGKLGEYKRKNGITDKYYNEILQSIPPGTWDERIHTKNKSVYEIREENLENGYLVKCCNHIKDFCWNDVDFNYYIEQTRKLLIGETQHE